MADRRNSRNFGNGKTLSAFTIRNLSRETATLANRGDALALKAQSALTDLSQHLKGFGIRYLEAAQSAHLESWAQNLHERITAGELSSSTTSSYISAINTVMATHDRYSMQLSAKEFGINRGQKFSNRNLANTDSSHNAFKKYCKDQYRKTGDLKFKALYHSVSIQHQAGLRFRESTQIKISGKNLKVGKLALHRGDGVKNGQPRTFTPSSMQGLRNAQVFVQQNRDYFNKGSLIPSSMSYRSYKSWAYKTLEKFRQTTPKYTNYHFHGNRHCYAYRQYENAWYKRTGIKISAPVISGKFGKAHIQEISDKTGLNISQSHSTFKEINLQIAETLGHHRVDSGYSYCGK